MRGFSKKCAVFYRKCKVAIEIPLKIMYNILMQIFTRTVTA